MRRFKKFAAAVLAAVMSVSMLTACGGGGGGGGVTPVTPAASVKGTKTYKLAQEGKGKSLYTECWFAETDEDTGALVEDKDEVIKQGTGIGGFYQDSYSEDEFVHTALYTQGKTYIISYPGTYTYEYYAGLAEEGDEDIGERIKDKNVSIDMDRFSQALGGTSDDDVSGGSDASVDFDIIDDSKVTVSTGTFTTPDKSHTYYAEIFTFRADHTVSATFAYDDNDNLKAYIEKDGSDIWVIFFAEFAFDSPKFNEARLNLANYRAEDITEEYIAGYKKVHSNRR